MTKRTMTILLAIILTLIIIPMNNAYAAPNPMYMTNYPMNYLNNQTYGVTHYFNNDTKPTNNGPVYDNPNNDDDIGASGWYEDTIDKRSVVRPGNKKHAAFGFCVDLEKHNMLGSAIKGQLSAKSNIYYDNYKGDDDSGIPFISQYNRIGHMIGTSYGDWHSVSNWIDNQVSIQVPVNAKYLIFGGRGVRDGGFLNKNMDFNVNNVSGYIWDNTAPWIVSITNDVPHKSPEQEKLTENAIPKVPCVYITMSENCYLYYMNVKLIDINGNTAVARLQNLDNGSSINYDNGDVTYKFRIMTEDIKNVGISTHFVGVQLNSMTAVDTFGNYTNDTKNLSCNKRVDLMSPIIETGTTPNTFVAKDAFGISKITKTFSNGTTNDSKDVLNVGGDIFVKDATTDTGKDVYLNNQLEISNYTNVTGMFDVKLEVWDLVKNYSCSTKKLFLISNTQPVKFKLINCLNPTFDFNAEKFNDNSINAKTNMFLRASDIHPSNLIGATIYYKWSKEADPSILSQDISNGWIPLKFRDNSNETEQITIPVMQKNDDYISYLTPAYKSGYLYIRPKLDDDTTNSPELRTGSMALQENGSSSEGLFNLVDSKIVKGEFVNLGCSCTGQNCSEDAVSHYGAIRNHNKAIGFKIIENSEYLNSIKYFVKSSIDLNSYISQGSLIKNTQGQYDIPIDSIKDRTGSYIVTVALYSNKGDVTVQDIKVNIESPVVSISNIMYNQATQNFDFTVSYNKNSIINNKLEDFQLEISDKDTVEFKDAVSGNNKLSLFALTEGSVIAKDDWDAQIGTKSFIRTEFVSDEQNTERFKAEFRASLSNMEKSGDAFIKLPGAKRVHIKYTTSNKVEVFNNNITVIKKSNIPPSINLVGGIEGSYFTKNDASTASAIKVHFVEPIVEISKANYMWADSAAASLINVDGNIGGTSIPVNSSFDFEPKDIPTVTGDVLYKPYYLIVYAENSAGKYNEKSFGPFYVLNDDINSKRFSITATDKALGDKQVLVSVDDRLYMINELTKADRVRVIWQKDKTIISKIYDLSFVREGLSTNVSAINVPYIELEDTDRVGGTYNLSKIELYNSADEKNILKSVTPINIIQTLPEYFVEISGLSDSGGTYAVNVRSDVDDISYQWSLNQYDTPTSWITTGGAVSGICFVPETKLSMINRSIYLFVKAHNNIYRSEKVYLKAPAVMEPIEVTSVNMGEMTGGYFGAENGAKYNVPIRITVKSQEHLNKVSKIEIYDRFSVTSGTAILLSNMYKISETEMAGFIPSIVTSSGAIKCNVFVNGVDLGDITSENKGADIKELNFERLNRIVSLEDASDASKIKLYQKDGKSYIFDSNGKTEIYTDGDYLLVYDDSVHFYAREISISGILYGNEDITIAFNPEKPSEGKLSGSITATISMIHGSMINDGYGIITDVVSSENKVIATAVATRSAIYAFDVWFANNQKIKYCVDLSFIAENYKPAVSTVTSSAAIAYTPASHDLTKDNVIAALNIEGLNLLSNNYVNSYMYDKNGRYSFIAKDAAGNLYEYVSEVNWIDKNCPKPIVKKYVWNDYDKDGVYDSGEKSSEIPKGYKTKYDVIAEVLFPHNSESDRPVQLTGADGFVAEDLSSVSGYAYKYIMAYKPTNNTDTVYRKVLKFTDTLANSLDYRLIIDEIDKTQLLTLLNYSTTEFTNRDVVVSVSANKPIKRYDIVEVTNDSGVKETIERDASPTYVFKQNGEKDFNYKEIEVVPGEEMKGSLKAVVTWIDKSIPQVITEYSKDATNKPVEVKFMIRNGVEQNAKLRYGPDNIILTDSGKDRIGTYTVKDNGNYNFEVINKYGTIGDIIIPINSIDKTAPEINIYGRDNVYIKVNDRYYDKGAYAFDNRDGDISAGIQVSSNVNTSLVTKGSPYKVVYTVTDKSGNKSTKTRYVHVLDVQSAVAIINDNVIDLGSSSVHDINLLNMGQVFVEFVGIEGSYTVKYAKGEGFDNAYFKTNGSYISKYGTFTAQSGRYVLYIQDQERNTRMITLNFTK